MKLIGSCIGLAAALLISIAPAAAQDVTYPERPGDRDFIVDGVHLISTMSSGLQV